MNHNTGEIETTEKSPIERMWETFTDASGLPFPNKWGEDEKDKWITPMKSISDAVNDDNDMRMKAIREAVKECRDKNIIVASPKSIMSTALHLISQWLKSQTAVDVTQADFLAYRNRLLAKGYNVRW